jgi:hypothetical protein
LPTADEIGPQAVDIRVVSRLGSSARTIRPGDRVTPGPGEDDELGLGPVAVRPSIEIDLGTIAFIYDFARAEANFVGDDGKPIAVGQAPVQLVEKTVERMRYATDWYISLLPITVVRPLESTSQARRIWATQLAVAAETFVVAHELGHAVLHSAGPPADDAQSQAREEEADLFALRLVLTADTETVDSGGSVFAYSGALFYLAVMELAEAYTDHAYSDQTHPHAGDRLSRLAMFAPALGVKQEQLEAAIVYVDGTWADLIELAAARRPSAPDPDHPPNTFAEHWRDAIMVAVLRGADGDAPTAQVASFVTYAIDVWPSVAIPVLADLQAGRISNKTIDVRPYVSRVLVPSLPAPARTAIATAIIPR